MPHYIVKLSACRNTDFPDRSDLPLPRLIYVASFNEASRVSRQFIEEHNLGSSESHDGEVFDGMTGERVGLISYNGRAWTPELDWQDRKLITL